MQWLDEHPDFMSNPVYLGSDSYAGIYTPILAQDIINGKIHIEHQHRASLIQPPHTQTRFSVIETQAMKQELSLL